MPLSTEAASLVTKHYILGKGGESGWLSICSRWFFNCSSWFSISKWRKNLPSQREAGLHWNFLGKGAFTLFTVERKERNGIGVVREILLRVREIQRESGSNFPWMERALTWLASRYIMKCVLHKPSARWNIHRKMKTIFHKSIYQNIFIFFSCHVCFYPVLKHLNLSAYVVVAVFNNVNLIFRLSLEMLFSAGNHLFFKP